MPLKTKKEETKPKIIDIKFSIFFICNDRQKYFDTA